MPKGNEEIVKVVKAKPTKDRTILGVPLGINRNEVKKRLKAARKKEKK